AGIAVPVADVQPPVTRDAEVAARFKRLDHPSIASLNGGSNPAIAIVDDGVDLVTEGADPPLHLGLDALDIALGCNRELAEIDEQHAQLGIVGEALFDGHRQHPLAQAHGLVHEYALVHGLRIPDDRGEPHVCENVAIDVDAWGHLDELKSA